MGEQERDELGRFAGDGAAASEHAGEATKKTWSNSLGTKGRIEANFTAAQAHLDAASVHTRNGDHEKAAQHLLQARAHRDAAGSTLKKWAKRKTGAK